MPGTCWDVSVQVPHLRHWRKVPSLANQQAIATRHCQSLSSPHPQSLPKLHAKSSPPTCEINTDCNRVHGGISRQILRLTERGSTLRSSLMPTSAARSLATEALSAQVPVPTCRTGSLHGSIFLGLRWPDAASWYRRSASFRNSPIGRFAGVSQAHGPPSLATLLRKVCLQCYLRRS
jgi:hypothetical protein